jgi:RNA polymerase sigma factor (sigma-70 family)
MLPRNPISPCFSVRYIVCAGGAPTAFYNIRMSAAPLTFFSQVAGPESARRPALLAQARRGDREAFAELVAPHMTTVYQRARRLTGNIADAEDVRQEALLKAWSRLEQFSGAEDETTNDFRAWVSRIGANASIDVLRQRRDSKMVSLQERRSPAEDTLGSGIPARGDNPEQRCARREMSRLLAGAIVQLPADLRQACLLRDVLHYSTQEVAERLGISMVAVRLRLFRARRRLRDKLQHAVQPKMQRADRRASDERKRIPETTRERFLPLSAAAECVCGD